MYWVQLALAFSLLGVLEYLWKRHDLLTRNTPERRTLYDFFQTYPWALGALGTLVAIVIADAVGPR